MFDRGGITETLDTAAGGGRGHHTIEVIGKTRESKVVDRTRILSVGGLSQCLRSTDYKDPVKVGIECVGQDRHMVGYNATLKHGGGYDEHSTCPECEGLQRSERKHTNDDCCNDVFAIDKGIRPEERDVANCIEARENRGLSKRKQEGTLICWKLK